MIYSYIFVIWHFFNIFFLGRFAYNKGTASDKHMREHPRTVNREPLPRKRKTSTIFWEVM